ncbi:hypothetical protein [Acinetobacter sp. P8-3-8]|uniref:hypothetical protein n=1 Tax=Acinetobacter sp. P8-3-8 TaxID=1029823 RepID=UPI0002487AE7|nr:hypothetical protein [Acinetobacter sp. P8-3-8]
MFQFKHLSFALFVFNSFLMNCVHAVSLEPMTEQQMSEVTGQALMSLTYVAPADTDNLEAKRAGGNTNIGFYKLGLEADLEINANIKKLQLGCGGANGPGDCDIDIDNFSLSGVVDAVSDTSANRQARVASDAILKNPFIQFAIQNPNQASTREIKGIRLSAENALGMLTFGKENSDTPNGINSMSGYMQIAAQGCNASMAASNPNGCAGIATVNGRNMTQADTGKSMTGRVDVDFLWIGIRNYVASNYNITLNSTTAPFSTNETTVYGSRLKSVPVTGTAYIQPMSFFQKGLAINIQDVIGAIDLNMTKDIDGTITGLQAALSMDESLGYVHKVKVDSPFSLSLQSQTLQWPGMKAAALKGWWMAFDNPVEVGKLTPANNLDIPNSVLADAMGPQGCSNGNAAGINCALYKHYNEGGAMAYCSGFSCFGGSLSIGTVNLPNTSVPFKLDPIKLAGQSFVPNCYGSLKFC